MNNYIEVFRYDYPTTAKYIVKVYQDKEYTGVLALANGVKDLLKIAHEYGATELKRGF